MSDDIKQAISEVKKLRDWGCGGRRFKIFPKKSVHYIDVLIKAVENPWLPIEQAPRDGTQFLIPWGYSFELCWWCETTQSFRIVGIEMVDGCPTSVAVKPRYFMFIPKAPNEDF